MRYTPITLCIVALAALTACRSSTCPPVRSAELLEPEVRQRLNLSPRTEGVRIVESARSVRVDIGLVQRVDARVEYDGRPRPIVLGLTRSDHIWSIDANFYPEGRAGLITLPLRIDTGASAQLSMSAQHAQRTGVTLVDEFPAGRSYTSFGPKDVQLGVLRAVRLGDVWVEPVQAQVECSNRSYHSLLGISALELFGHAIFDWPNRRLILLPRGWKGAASLRARPGWQSVPWTNAPIRTKRDTVENRGRGSRDFHITTPLRWAPVQINGRTHAALIDTGFSADVFAFEPLGIAGETDTVTGFGFGRTARFDSIKMLSPIRLGPLAFDNTSVIEPRDKGLDIVQRAGFDVIVGLGVLERHPLWLDFQNNELRFWTANTPLPPVTR